jgi:urease accessory protein
MRAVEALVAQPVAQRPAIERPQGDTAYIKATFHCMRGQSQLLRSSQTAPLKIAKTFPSSDGAVDVCLMDCSPGLLNGDRYKLEWNVEDNACVKITTQSFTKVHPSSGAGCRQRTRIRIASGGLLEYAPQPTMLFRDADFRVELEADVTSGGTLLLSDILCAGRIGRGEELQFSNYSNQLIVRYDEELIFCSRNRFQPHLQNLRAVGSWGSNTHYGTFFVFSSSANLDLLEAVRQVLGEYSNISSGASLTYKNGVAVAALAAGAWSLQELFAKLGSCAKRHVCNA